jgi:hypothetical protein
MRWPAVMGAVALTELAAHFLSLGWGLMTLLAAFAWVALSGATVAAKARSTEARLGAHVTATAPAVSFVANGGSVGGNVVVNGSHTVTGQVNANTYAGVSGGAMENSSGIHTSGTLVADTQVNAGQVTSSSSFSGGSIHVSGNAQADGSMTATSYSGSSIHVSGNGQVDGSFSANNFSGSYAGGQSAVTTSNGTLASTASAVNGCIARMQSAGLI